MSKFTKSVRHEIEFEGDTVTMTLQRLKRKDMHKLIPYLQTEGGVTKLSFKDQAEFSDVTIGFLPEYIENFHGLKDANGDPILKEDVLSEIYFSSIVTSIITKLFEISRMSGEEEKNFDAPLGTDMKDLVPETRNH